MWLRRIRGMLGMGFTWALGWGLTGILIGALSVVTPFFDWAPFFRVFDAPLPAMAVPGFFAGGFFSLVLSIAGRNRKFRDLSLPVFTAWGALGGVLLSFFPMFLFAVGLASRGGTPDEVSTWRLTLLILPFLTLMSAISAAVTLKIAQRAEDRSSSGDHDGPTAQLGEGSTTPAGVAEKRAAERVR
jgi:hypothetical protein